jgi:amino acid adenylation domain-containing protein
MAFLLHHLLEESSKQHPGRKALVDREREITYSELNSLSNQLANFLVSRGVRRGERVAFVLRKSLESIITMFGVLKAGAVYVPIDPLSPVKRLQRILSDCSVKVLVSSNDRLRKLGNILEEVSSLQLILVANDVIDQEIKSREGLAFVSWPSALDGLSPDFPEKAGIDRDLAYILYTSGSTGDPKGVMISHLNALTFVNWSYEEFGIQQSDRVSNHAPLHFDLPVFDIFTSFKAGATVFLVPEELSVFPRALIRFIRDNKITIWYSVPSILVHLLVHGNLGNYSFPDLRLILFAGEVFPVKHLRELMKAIPQASFFNLYGPVETNVCTFHEVKQITPNQSRPVPIGKACRNYEVFLVDQESRTLAATGEMGELYVRGSGVAEGYWADVEKTKSRFLLNWSGHFCDERVYATGDLAHKDGDGNYHLVGRKDHMIKSRGYRIELGEIESALYANEQVVEAAVAALPDELITNRLTAYVVTAKGSSLTAVDLKKHLHERIPEYMIPETIEFRDSLPKTSTGKIDRLALASHQSNL